ncbi:MAG: HAMP domain-containing histidine kinase [Cyclobacteriaceae bacterium]|nr:HAMP domain-containing histidine kinase [Cyclobacteriaceae bacterium]
MAVTPDIEELLQQLEELQKEKLQLISIVSHDIKSPLNRLYALIQLMQLVGDNLTSEQQDYLEKMHLVVADGLDMIRNLVDYRNIENNRIDLLPEDFNIQSLIQQTVKNFSGIADKKRITLLAESENIKLHTDRQCLQRAVDAILSNALKFSFEGKKVWLRAYQSKPGMVAITIRDEAQGFKPDELPHLFERFRKFSARTTGGESSTGLGLFIAKKMTEKIGGNIICKNEEGVGAAFTIEVPTSVA